MPGHTVLYSALLDPEPARFCAELSRNLGFYYQIYFPGNPDNPRETLLAEQFSSDAESYQERSGIKILMGDLQEALAAPALSGCIKAMFITDLSNHDRIRRELDQRFGNTISVVRSSNTFLEIMSPGVSKGTGLRCALEHLGLTPDQVIAFGDEENDLPLFKTAGFSAAPANAKPEVLQAADFHIPSNTEDGVAAFLGEIFGI
jgi:Cof subfamily protein (haloacid dehalogenase superfamily)